MVAVCCFGCGFGEQAVTVKKSPASITYRLVPKSAAAKSNKELSTEEKNFFAHTTWLFSCRSSFDYAVMSERRGEHDRANGLEEASAKEEGTCSVEIVVKRVQMEISLPIQVTALQDVSEKVLQHERGHVSLCQRIYKGADIIAADCARAVIGAKFIGRGSDSSAAQQAALDSAAEQICKRYRELTVYRVNDASDRYDRLSSEHPSLSIEDRIETALAQVDKHSNN